MNDHGDVRVCAFRFEFGLLLERHLLVARATLHRQVELRSVQGGSEANVEVGVRQVVVCHR